MRLKRVGTAIADGEIPGFFGEAAGALAPVPQDLALMLQALRDAPAPYAPSPRQQRTVERFTNELRQAGFANFRRATSLNNAGRNTKRLMFRQIRALLPWWIRRGRGSPFAARISEPMAADNPYHGLAGRLYALYVALLYHRVTAEYGAGLFQQCAESPAGNPIEVRVAISLRTTEDMCGAIHAFSRVNRLLAAHPAPGCVLELGAGYGLRAAVCLHAVPELKYWIVDNPPSLYLAQRYLSELFPRKKLFRFRPFADFAEVAAEIAQSDICFFMPHQLPLLPARAAGAALCVNALHDMTKAQREQNFSQLGRVLRGTLYTTQWVRPEAAQNDRAMFGAQYPTPAGWRGIFNRRHPMFSDFIESAYWVG
jgi:putative sugar O-methyltransferase